jgi:hypothetical protein
MTPRFNWNPQPLRTLVLAQSLGILNLGADLELLGFPDGYDTLEKSGF